MQGNGTQPSNDVNSVQDGKGASVEPADSLKYAVFLLDKKVRNLEKKKAKIERYVREQKQGKELNEDQIQAISRLDETNFSLQAAREMKKQFEEVSNEVARLQKKQTRKSILAEKESRRIYLKEIFQIKGLLHALVNFPDFADMFNGTLKTDEEKSIIGTELTQIGKGMQFDPEEMISENNNEYVNRFFCLVEGKAKPIKQDVPSITYASAKAAILSMKDVWQSTFESQLGTSHHKNPMMTNSVATPQVDTNEDIENSSIEVAPVQQDAATIPVEHKGPEEPQTRQSTLEDQAQAAIRSLTFTNRNFPTQQMNTHYSYDMMYDQMDMMGQPTVADIPHEASQAATRSPVAFVATGGYDGRQAAQIPTVSSTEDVGFFVPIAPQFQQQAMRYGNFADPHAFAHIPQVQFAGLHRQPQMQQPQRYSGYEQRSYRRERPPRGGGGYNRPANQRGFVPQGSNDLTGRRMPFRGANPQSSSQNY